MSRKIQKVILLIDTSGSMSGEPIESLKKAVKILARRMERYDNKYSRVDLQIISFDMEAKYVSKNSIDSMVAYGRTNLLDVYKKLNMIFAKHRTFDFHPIVALLCDGKPNIGKYKPELKKLFQKPAFRKSLRLAFAYCAQDDETLEVLNDFTHRPKNVFIENNPKEICRKIDRAISYTIKYQTKQNGHYTPPKLQLYYKNSYTNQHKSRELDKKLYMRYKNYFAKSNRPSVFKNNSNFTPHYSNKK